MNKTLYLLRGIPGCGKTSLAKTLLGLSEEAVMFAADDYFETPEGYNWDASKIKEAHSKCQANVSTAMGLGVEVIIVHNTSTTTREIQVYLDYAKQYNYQVVSLVVENRHGGVNTHNVPEETLVKMKERFTVKL